MIKKIIFIKIVKISKVKIEIKYEDLCINYWLEIIINFINKNMNYLNNKYKRKILIFKIWMLLFSIKRMIEY
jgi:hypothetical protein